MRQKINISQKAALRRIIILASSVVTVLSVCLVIFINLSNSKDAFAGPSLGDYRSTGSGNWNALATWQKYDGSDWIAATTIPSTAEEVITILNGHSVTVTSNTT